MELYAQQLKAADWLTAQDEAILLLPVGYGKTAIALHAIDAWRRAGLGRTLVVSTKAICELTWGQEIEKWGFDMTYASAAGRRTGAVQRVADVTSINFESLGWYFDKVDRKRMTKWNRFRVTTWRRTSRSSGKSLNRPAARSSGRPRILHLPTGACMRSVTLPQR